MKSRALAAAGLAVFVLALVGCGGGSSNPVASTPVTGGGGGGGVVADVTITISGFAFSPNPASVTAGQRVAWRNADSVSHTATSDDGAFNTGTIAPGATSSAIVMPAAGNFAYHCAIHPNMVASLTVTP